MATTYTLRSFNEPAVVGTAFPGRITRQVTIDWVDVTGDADYAFIINDVVKAFKVPPKAKILGAKLSNKVDLDDGASTLELDVQLTDGTITKTLIDGGTTTGTLATVREGAAPATEDAIGYVTSDDDFWIQLKAIAASNGDAAANAVSILEVSYTMILEPGEYV